MPRSQLPPDLLARAFIDILRREAGQTRQRPAALADGDLDDLLGTLDEPADREASPPLRPDLVAAAVSLARAIEAEEGLLQALRRGAPAVTVQVPSAEWVDPMERAVELCALGSQCLTRGGDGSRLGSEGIGQREALVVARDGSSTNHRPDKGNEAVGDALMAGHAVIGIAAEPARLLPRDLTRASDYRIAAGGLDAAGVALVIEAATGASASRSLAPRLAALCEPADLRLSVRHGGAGDAALDRLDGLLRGKLGAAGSGPRLEELHGYGAAKAWGLDLVEDLRRWRAGEIPFSACESALLLSGPPGCGKTRFGMALARSAGLPFLAGSLGQWQSARDGHLGHTLGAMRQFFERARREPCVALIDELDSFGDRDAFASDHRDYSSQVVNALLELLDGAASREGMVVIGATNLPDRIDPAIRRSGRLDRHIRIGLPGLDDLKGILRHYLGGELARCDLTPAAVQARGLTGADVEAAVRRARGAARRAGRSLAAGDLRAALADGMPPLSERVRLRAAVHEAGHGLAVVASGASQSVVLSVQAAGGLTEVDGIGEVGAATEAELEDFLVMTLAGRAAEEVILGDVSAGAVSDLAAATRCAGLMEARYGFSAEFPLVSVGLGDELDLARLPWLLRPVQVRLQAAYDRALDLMRTERLALERLARALFAHGYLDDPEVRALVAGRAARAPRNPAKPAPARGRRPPAEPG